jgi:hypothetical protein
MDGAAGKEKVAGEDGITKMAFSRKIGRFDGLIARLPKR